MVQVPTPQARDQRVDEQTRSKQLSVHQQDRRQYIFGRKESIQGMALLRQGVT